MTRLPYYGPPDANQFIAGRQITDPDSGQPADVQKVDDDLARAVMEAIRDRLPAALEGGRLPVETELTQLADVATQTTLEAIRVILAGEDFATEATLAALRDRLPAALEGGRLSVETELTDVATQTTLAAVLAAVDGVEGLLTTIRDRTLDPTLTGRMLEKKPATGYRLWLDGLATPVTITDGAGNTLATGTMLAEAPAGSAETDAVWRGIHVPEASGQVRERTGFAWNARTTGWT